MLGKESLAFKISLEKKEPKSSVRSNSECLPGGAQQGENNKKRGL